MAGVSLVQHTSKDAGTNSSASLAFPANNTAGNWIGVVIRAGHSGQVFTVGDTRGNTYKQAVQFNQTLDAPNGETLAIYYAENIAGGANTVTVAESLANNTLRFAILEYSGLATSNSIDVTSAAQGSGTTLNTGTATTSVGGDLILGEVAAASGVTFTAGSGYTIEERVPAAPNTKMIAEDAIQATAGPVTVSATLSISENGGAMLAAFKAAASGTLPPSIASLNPTSGAVGTSVTITGANFGASQGASTVTFNGTAATPGSWSTSSITVPVPAGSTTGNVVVTVGGQSSNPVTFTVLIPPVITSLSPVSGPIGMPVTITGANFGATLGTVTFNGVAVTQGISWTPTSISLSVPAGASTGNVVVNAGGLASNGVTFTVTNVPLIFSLNPISGAVGTSVSITGAGFGATQGSSTVSFGGTLATPTFWSQTGILTPVPAGANSGNVIITVGGQASNGINFAVTIISVSLAPPMATVPTGTSTSFTATVQNDVQNKGVTWVLSGAGCTGLGCGSFIFPGSGQGTYTGPSIVPNPPTVTLTATSVADPTKSASAIITVIQATPVITSLSPISGTVGTSVTISGSNLGPSQGNSTVTFNGTLATPTSWSTSSIVAAVPSGSSTGNVVVTVGGAASSGTLFTVIPSISSSSPASGPVGTSVTITGDGFGLTQGTSTVTFNGTPASPTSWSTTSIVVSVPSGATTGSVLVTVGGMATNSSGFFIVVPNITSLSPSTGAVGTLVTITGTTFGATQGVSQVTFNGIPAVPTSWSSTSIIVPVPSGASTGNVVVTVSGGAAGSSNGVIFTVPPAPVSVTAVNPSSGTVGTSVTITGTGFGATQSTSTVSFNGTFATPTSWSSTSIVAPVPAGTVSGNIVVTVGGVASNSVLFTVLPIPSITAIIPPSGPVGSLLTISGTNFGATQGTSTVTFNGAPAGTASSWNPTSIGVLVPAAATTGNVVVTVGGAASNSLTFTIGPDITPPTVPTNLTSTAISPAGASLLWNASTDNVGIASYLLERCQGTGCTTFVQIVAVQAPNTSIADTSLVATTSYSYRVRAMDAAGNLSAYSNVLSITTTSGPVIQTCNPNFGPIGTPVTVGGTGFGAVQGSSTITFNGITANPTSWSDTSINVSVPVGASTGNMVVTVAGVSSNLMFVVTPTITKLSPISGPRGTSVTITGTNFGATVGASTVTFNGVPGTWTSWSDTSIVVPVPFGATNGNVLVTVGGPVNGHASNAVFFTVTTALVQHASKDAGTTSSSSLAFPANNTGGNWIGVVIRAGHSGQTFAVSDSRGNAYRQALSFNQTFDTPNGDTLAIFYAENIADGGNTVTVSNSSPNNTLRFALLEYSGLAASNSLDVTGAAQGTGASVSSGNITTTAPGDLILGALMTGSGVTYSPGSGFVIEERVPAAPNTKLIGEDQIQAAAGGVAATATLSASASWGSALAAFRSASAALIPPPNITSLIPASGPVGTSVTIAGANFGAPQGNSTVTFNGIAVTPGSWSTTGISVVVPAALATGNATVVVTVKSVSSNAATFTVTPPPAISVAITPVRGGITVTQPLLLTAAVQNDSSNAGVTWSVSGGTLSGQTSSVATFTATGPGVYTITATSKADVTRSASAVIGVTDLAGVTTWRDDNARSGINPQEYALTPQNVTTGTFAKLFSCPVDGQVFAQPLWVANVSIGGTSHNVVFVATENDSLYAFDADSPSCNRVWTSSSVSLIPSGEVIVPFADLQKDNALGPVVGVTGTPVIDLTSQTIYLVALTEVSGSSNVIQRLHAIDITTGRERTGSPQIISASINNASGYDNSGGVITFAPNFQKQRPALLLLNGVIYISWAGFLDTDFYHGWVIGYDGTTLAQVSVFNDTPDGGRGGIWMSGGGPAADAQGNIYLLTGNGDFNANSTGGRNYGDTFLKLGTSGGLSVSDWFTPHDQSNMANNDLDLGGGGAVILFDQSGGPFPHLVLGGSKGGMLYVVSRDGLGNFNSTNDSQIVQSFVLGSNGIYSAPLFWQNTLYAAGSGSTLGAYPFSPATDQFQTSPSVVSSQIFSHPGTTPSLSANGTSNAILWVIRRPSATSAAVLHAFDPANIHTALWDSTQATGNRDQAGVAVKFTVPTVANGKVYIGTMTELDVYGLLPN